MKKTLQSRKPISDRELATAYHEAGHAIAHLVFGLPLKLVSIRPNATSMGRVTPGRKLCLLPPKECSIEIISLLAGAVSQEYFTPVRGGHDGDVQRAHDFAFLLFKGNNSQARRFSRRCARNAERLIESTQLEVQQLVDVLIESKELTGYEAAQVINPGLHIVR